jgi:hypothetical protein
MAVDSIRNRLHPKLRRSSPPGHAATVLLEGSQGRIGYVVLVKLEPLKDDETSIQIGFVEVHMYDSETGKRQMIGRGMVRFGLYFIPFSMNNFLFRNSTLHRPTPAKK